MSKIDVNSIEGYADLTTDEKLKLLEGYDFPEPDMSKFVRKDQFDRTASELAAKKKELREKLSDEEANKQKEQEEREAIMRELESLRKESAVSKNKANLVALGYEEKLADETALAMFEGKLDIVFANQKKHMESFEKQIRSEAFKNTPKPVADGDTKTMTLNEFRELSAGERAKFYLDHPDEYRELYAGGTEDA